VPHIVIASSKFLCNRREEEGERGSGGHNGSGGGSRHGRIESVRILVALIPCKQLSGNENALHAYLGCVLYTDGE
jgi:hypothetical protein